MGQINLWNVYYMTTNAKTDVWTQVDFSNKHISSLNLVGQPKNRITIPIQKLRTLKSGEEIYLVCQFNSISRPNSVRMPKSLRLHDPKIHGSVLPINIRMASSNEFINFGKILFVNQKERPLFYKDVWKQLLNNPWLERRLKKIKAVMKGDFDNFDQQNIIKLIETSQFNLTELKLKGKLS